MMDEEESAFLDVTNGVLLTTTHLKLFENMDLQAHAISGFTKLVHLSMKNLFTMIHKQIQHLMKFHTEDERAIQLLNTRLDEFIRTHPTNMYDQGHNANPTHPPEQREGDNIVTNYFQPRIRRITPIQLTRPNRVPGYDPNEAKVYVQTLVYNDVEQGLWTRVAIPMGHWICDYGGIMEYRETMSFQDSVGNATMYDPRAKVVCYGNKVTSFGPMINEATELSYVNATIYFDYDLGCMNVFATRDIKAYEEVLTNYGRSYWSAKCRKEKTIIQSNRTLRSAHPSLKENL
jgi:hypothetical protein